MKFLPLILTLIVSFYTVKGDSYWQQRVEYNIDVALDVETHKFDGKESLKYFNNSPDTLNRLFFHLFFNAFQPGSMMDVRSRNIEDPDGRIGDRIESLTPDQIGFQKISKMSQDGKKLSYRVLGTILEVSLGNPLFPGQNTSINMSFTGQVPVQIRRSGRDNKEGISYSMAQWYPKLCEYDQSGWHTYPYVGREFYGVWGDFNVSILIDSSFTVGGSGVLQNADEIGHGYAKVKQLQKTDKGRLEWKFRAENVHDFVWAADPDYTHKTLQMKDGPLLHFLFQEGEDTEEWDVFPEYMEKAIQYMSTNFGKYPYPQYSFIQGGDGGMEYPMATLITGHRSKKSLVGVGVHELNHSWYQMVLATNEAKYPWMDEGFTTYTSSIVMGELFPKSKKEFMFRSSYSSYYSLVNDNKEEVLTTHADHYHRNRAYGVASYSKGVVFLAQLEYVIGRKTLRKSLKRYFNEWKFKHPTPTSFELIVEKESGMNLDWYFEQFIHSTNYVDYGINKIIPQKDGNYIQLAKNGKFMMPLEIEVLFTNGSSKYYYIPIHRSLQVKKEFDTFSPEILEEWPWTHNNYGLLIPSKYGQIESITLDPSLQMADINRKDNSLSTKDLIRGPW